MLIESPLYVLAPDPCKNSTTGITSVFEDNWGKAKLNNSYSIIQETSLELEVNPKWSDPRNVPDTSTLWPKKIFLFSNLMT